MNLPTSCRTKTIKANYNNPKWPKYIIYMIDTFGWSLWLEIVKDDQPKINLKKEKEKKDP